jgi:hypothetical protein
MDDDHVKGTNLVDGLNLRVKSVNLVLQTQVIKYKMMMQISSAWLCYLLVSRAGSNLID